MEELRENKITNENAETFEVVSGVATGVKETVEKNAPEAPEQIEPKPQCGVADNNGGGNDCEKKHKCCGVMHWIVDGVLAIAIIVLFILHFCGGEKKSAPVAAEGTPGTGEVVYINIDSVNANYEMVSVLTDSLDAEKQKQTIVFQNRQKALENKLANYQRNMQSGSLTAQQAQYAEASLQQESQQLQADYATTLEDLEARYAAALEQITDSVKASVARVNANRKASFVLSYGANGPVVCADPTKDITEEVLADLNKPFGKKKKSK